MWRKVVQELKDHDRVGPALPLACNRHPDTIIRVSVPGQIPLFAPEGKAFLLDHTTPLTVPGRRVP